MRNNEISIPFVPAFIPFYAEKARYKFAFGGRGGAKSIAFSDIALLKGRERKMRILCAREIQKSIQESVHSLLESRANAHGFTDYTTVKSEIRNELTGSEFIFTGLQSHTVNSIKSYHGINICWVEEAQSVTQKSLDILTPTIREKNSELWFSYNRMEDNDPVHALFKRECDSERKKKFISNDGTEYTWVEYRGKNAVGIFINYDGNPYFPEVLRREMEQDKASDYETYLHKWLGEPIAQGENSVVARSVVAAAMERTLTGQEGGIVIGCDVARFGTDRSVIYKRKGMKIIDEWVGTKKDTVYVARKIAEMAGDRSASIRVDDTGVGGGVTDHLTDAGYRPIPINFGDKAYDADKFGNLVSEIWFDTAEALKTADIPKDEALKEELCGRKYKYDRSERKILETKDEYKKRIGRSPDKADALCLCLFAVKNRANTVLAL